MQSPDSQADGQTSTQDTSVPAQPEQGSADESTRVNKLMSTLGRRTNERDAAQRERDAAIAERNAAQQQLDAILAAHGATPTQQQVLSDFDTEQAPPPKVEPVTDRDGNVLMTEEQWRTEERAGRTFVPVTPRKVATPRDTRADLMGQLDSAINAQMRRG